ncbi:MAG: hypothetical protein RLO18_01160 [Gimesia chilikensis]
MYRCLIIVFTLAVLSVACIAEAQQGNRPVAREQWRAIYLRGKNVGYVHDAVETVNRDGKQVVVNTHTSVVSVSGNPDDSRARVMIQTDETVDGKVLSYRYQAQNTPLVNVLKQGRVTDGQVRIQTETNGQTLTKVRQIPADVKGPAYADRLMLDQPLKANESRVITTFDPRSAQVDTIRFEARQFENVLLQDGKERRLLHVVVSHSITPSLVIHEFLDEAGETWKTTIPAQDMVVYTTTRDAAIKLFGDVENR